MLSSMLIGWVIVTASAQVMWLELVLGVFAVVLLVFYWWTVQTDKYKCIAQIPGPLPLPILGNILLFANTKQNLSTFLKLFNKYGPVFRLWFGSKPMLIVRDPDMLKLILRSSTSSRKGHMYRYLKPWLIDTLLTSTDETYQIQKKSLSLCMNFKILEHYLSVFNSACDILVEVLSEKADGKTCNIAPFITSYALEVIVESALGAKLNCQRQPNNEYAKAIHIMGTVVVNRIFSSWKSNDFLFMFSKDHRDQKKACNILNDFAKRIIEKRKKLLLESKEDNEDMNDNGKKMTRVIDILLNTTVDDKPLSEERIIDDLSGFIFAGHDTTAAVLHLLFYQLSNNQVVQNKMVDELKEIFGNDKNRHCTIEDTHKMKYMERVIKESMRFIAPVPFIGRTLEEHVHYKNIILPKGLELMFYLYGLHKNPDLYDEPDVFDPDRFLSEDSIQPYSFLPFSSGPRNCKGQKYALLELKVTISKLLRNFEFLPAGPGSELELVPCLVMQSSNGINVRMKHREF